MNGRAAEAAVATHTFGTPARACIRRSLFTRGALGEDVIFFENVGALVFRAVWLKSRALAGFCDCVPPGGSGVDLEVRPCSPPSAIYDVLHYQSPSHHYTHSGVGLPPQICGISRNRLTLKSSHIIPAVRLLGALGVQLSTSHPGPGSSEAPPAGRMIGIGLRAREP